MTGYPRPVARLIDSLERLPGVGPKSAQRLALWFLRQPAERVEPIAQSILDACREVQFCPVCGFFSEGALCRICTDSRREAGCVCVVGDVHDLLAIEETGEYHGSYHVLGGVLSPIDGIGPAELNIDQLLSRVDQGEITEVIVALDPTPEGDTTAGYLARLVAARGVKVTRPALGLPVGGDLNYADRMTIVKALEGRREMS